MSEQKIIINVGRQLGSGGHIIAERLAQMLHCQFLDREILCRAACESGFSEKFFEQNDENKGFLRGMLQMFTPHPNTGNLYRNGMSQASLFKFQSDAIRHAADEGSCVFVGRGADYILRDYPNVLNVFITADLDERVRRVAERHQCDADHALHIIRQREKERASFYNFYTGKTWGAAESYHLCINSSVLGIDGTAQWLADYARCAQKDTQTELSNTPTDDNA